jgi:hypothetical protein
MGRKATGSKSEYKMEKVPMTKAGHAAVETELKQLKSIERPAIIKAIAEAREHGDLSENAEYHSAREKHSFIEGRVKDLEGILSLAEVIDPASLSGSIKFGRVKAGLCMARPARRGCVAPFDHCLHASGDFNGRKVQTVRGSNERPDPRSWCRVDESGRQV